MPASRPRPPAASSTSAVPRRLSADRHAAPRASSSAAARSRASSLALTRGPARRRGRRASPPDLHNRPGGIAAAVARTDREARERYGRDDRIFVAYADCGTGGAARRASSSARASSGSPGAHCYEFYAGAAAFAAIADEEPGTFYLTDFLARNFDRLVIARSRPRPAPRAPGDYFGNYRRVVYLAQTDDPALTAAARARRRPARASRFEHRPTGLRRPAPRRSRTAPSPRAA